MLLKRLQRISTKCSKHKIVWRKEYITPFDYSCEYLNGTADGIMHERYILNSARYTEKTIVPSHSAHVTSLRYVMTSCLLRNGVKLQSKQQGVKSILKGKMGEVRLTSRNGK